MAHVSEEVAPDAVGGAMGLFVAGNTVGGLSGRLLSSAVADVAGWRAGLAAVGVLALVCVVAFRLLLPPPTTRRPDTAARPALAPRPAPARPVACAGCACRASSSWRAS
jgi:predicted MFS family arabinose efflux permease